MILIDANLLLYAKDADSPHHQAAVAWLDDRLSSGDRVGLPWPSLLAFVRIITNPRIYPQPLDAEPAWQQVEEWLSLEGVWVPLPTDRHSEILGRLLRASHATANLVPDAHLAALAVEHGLTICSTDGDFARFPGVRWQDPLRPKYTSP